MPDPEEIELYVWKGDWGLPTVDAECLQVLTYAKFAGIPIKVEKQSNPFRTPHGRFPVLRCGNTILDTVPDIIQFFESKNYTLSGAKDESIEWAEILAYGTMLKEMLFPALQFLWWIDKRNVDELVRPWYSKAIPFPLNFYYTAKFEKDARDFFQTVHASTDDLADLETKVYSEAQKCIASLSTRLGEKKYFFGNEFTALDATLYSYLAPLISTPLPNAALQNHLKASTSLVEYVSRITQGYFPDDKRQYEKQKAKENAEKLGTSNDYPNKRRNQILAGIFVTLSMASYVLTTGIVKVPTTDIDPTTIEEYELDNEDEE